MRENPSTPRLHAVAVVAAGLMASVLPATGALGEAPPPPELSLNLDRFAWLDDEPTDKSNALPSLPPATAKPYDKRWHIELSFRISATRLDRTESLLSQRLDRPLRLDVLNVFDHPHTPLDRRTNGGLNAIGLGIGRSENDWLTWTAYVIGGIGEDGEHQRWLNLNLKTRFRYGSYQGGVRFEAYPLGRPDPAEATSLAGVLGAVKPYLMAAVEGGYVTGEGRGRYWIAPLPTIYRDQVKLTDWVLAFPVGLGVRFPLDKNWSFSVSGDYTFHLHAPEEFNGWHFRTSIRYEFDR